MTRRRELTEYLKVLTMLNENGFKCRDKIEQVLEELHKEMGFKEVTTFSTSINISSGVINTGGILVTDKSNQKNSRVLGKGIFDIYS